MFYWLVDRGLEPPSVEALGSLPIRAKSTKALVTRLREQVGKNFALRHLNLALRQPRKDVSQEVSDIVLELYERTFASRLQAAALERSAIEIPELFGLFFMGVRRALLAQLTDYIAARVESGHFALVTHPATAARFVLESVTFFARHRFNDPDLSPGDDDAVRRTVVELLVRSLVGKPMPHKPRRSRVRH